MIVLHNREQERIYKKQKKLSDKEERSFIQENLQEDGHQCLIMVIMDAAVDYVGSFERQEKSVFQIEASYEHRSVLTRAAHHTYPQTVVA